MTLVTLRRRRHTKNLSQCQESGMSIERVGKQKQIGKQSESTEFYQNVAIGFAVPFQHAMNAKRSLLVGLSRWFFEVAGSKVFKKSTKDGVKEVLKKYKAGYGTPQVLRTDPVTIQKQKCLRKLCAATKKAIEIPKKILGVIARLNGS